MYWQLFTNWAFREKIRAEAPVVLSCVDTFQVVNSHLFPSEFFQMQCCRRTVKITLTDSAKNEQVLRRVKEESKIVHKIKRRKSSRIGHMLRRNYLLKCVTERKMERRMEVVGTWGWKHKQLLDDVKAKERYWKFKEEATDRTPSRTRFGRSYGTVLRESAELVCIYWVHTRAMPHAGHDPCLDHPSRARWQVDILSLPAFRSKFIKFENTSLQTCLGCVWFWAMHK
jgi:hypothetical protein